MRPRKLRPEEAKLWGRIAASTKPYHPKHDEKHPVEDALSAYLNAEPAQQRPIHAKLRPDPRPTPPKLTPPNVADVSGHKNVRRGRLQIDGQIDLHGMRQVEAQRALAAFLHRVRAEGGRCVLVVTGKGRAIEGGEDFITPQPGVIRRRLPEWLNHEAIRDVVAGFSSANARHGGTGAYYVLLKRT